MEIHTKLGRLFIYTLATICILSYVTNAIGSDTTDKFKSNGNIEKIIVDIAIGCPSIQSYEKYLTETGGVGGSSKLEIAAKLNCRMFRKGDRVELVNYSILKNLVNVHPLENSMSFWLPSEFVSSGSKVIPAQPILKLRPFVISLADKANKSKDQRYMKIDISVEFESTEYYDNIQQFNGILRDNIIKYLTTLTSKQVLSTDGKHQLKSQLLKIIKESCSPFNVKNIYFTDLIVQ